MQKSKCNSRKIKPGDLVLIENENKKRLAWPLGRVEEVFPGRDGVIRVVRLRTVNGILIRPIQKLYPLEASDSDEFKEKIERKLCSNRSTEDQNTGDEIRTRYGRKIKAPSKLCY